MVQDINLLYSLLISILLINGFYNFSYHLSLKFNTYVEIKDKFLSTIIIFFIITNLIAILTFNINLYYKLNNKLILILSLSIISIGFYKPIYFLKCKEFFKFKMIKNYKLSLIYLILFSYFLLSLSPITDSDTLDYHLTIPLYNYKFGTLLFPKYWLTSQLSGSGESLFTYSLSLGGYHFSQILQFLSLFLIISIVLKFEYKKKINLDNKYLICLIILTMPALVFLISTSKPQIFPIACNFLSIILVFFYLPKLNLKKSLILYGIIIFLLFCTVQIKFSFLLSSSLISLFATYVMLKKRLFLKSIFITTSLFLIIILPREYYEFLSLNKNILFNFFNPVTDLFMAESFNTSLKHGSGNNRFIPLWIIFPLSYGSLDFSKLTYSLGPFILFFLYKINFRNKILKQIFLLSLMYFVLSIFLAQPVGRFFVEVFIWLTFFTLLYHNKPNDTFIKFFEKILLFSSFIYFIVLIYFSFFLFSANFSKKNYDNILSKNADGYLLYEWANSVLPDNTTIISTHRSNAFYKSKVIPYEFRLYNSKSKGGYKYYLHSIINENPKYILYTSTEHNNKYDFFKKCRNNLVHYKKNVGYVTGRNPFSNTKKFYDGYIYKIDKEDIKMCIK